MDRSMRKGRESVICSLSRCRNPAVKTDADRAARGGDSSASSVSRPESSFLQTTV
jgi:hypothetical protein